jgi:Zn-dependent protease with chaperone function
MRKLIVTAALLLLTGCAGASTAYTVATPDAVASERTAQEQLVNADKWERMSQRAPASFSAQFASSQRLAAVAERVLIAAAPYCEGRVMNAYPVNVGTRDQGPPEVLNAADPLRPGDRITAINGRAVPGGKQGYVFLNREGGNLTRTGQPLQLSALRGRQRIEATYNVVPACAFNLNMQDNNQWNAYADGETMHVERKLVDDLSNDDDLAFVIAHELAHNLVGHVGKTQQNMMAGALIGLGIEAAIGAMGGGSVNGEIARAGAGVAQMRYSQDFEREADYVGLYILANTGYDLNAGPRVARRIAEQDPRAITYAGSHPSSADRAASLMATIREIEDKVKRGQPLAPNMAPKRS